MATLGPGGQELSVFVTPTVVSALPLGSTRSSAVQNFQLIGMMLAEKPDFGVQCFSPGQFRDSGRDKRQVSDSGRDLMLTRGMGRNSADG